VAYAVQRPTYASAFYAGGAVLAGQLGAGREPVLQAEYLPGYDISQARSRIAESGLSAAGLAVELAYPSGTSTSLLPDPKGLARGDRARPASRRVHGHPEVGAGDAQFRRG